MFCNAAFLINVYKIVQKTALRDVGYESLLARSTALPRPRVRKERGEKWVQMAISSINTVDHSNI